MSQFDPKFFDKDFYIGGCEEKGYHKRNENNEHYIEFSRRLTEAFKGSGMKTVLDIGAGVGVRTINHINNGFDAYPCDISQWAYDNSMLPNKHYCCDVRNMKKIKQTFDIVISERQLGYIPAEDALMALEQIDSKAKHYIVFSIICSDHIDPNIPIVAKPGRLNIAPKKFWEDLFARFDWKLDEEKTRAMLEPAWDCLWVYKK